MNILFTLLGFALGSHLKQAQLEKYVGEVDVVSWHPFGKVDEDE